MKVYDKIGRESGEFPNTEKELKDLKIYEEKLKRMKAKVKKHLDEDIEESKKSIEEDKELKKTIGKMI